MNRAQRRARIKGVAIGSSWYWDHGGVQAIVRVLRVYPRERAVMLRIGECVETVTMPVTSLRRFCRPLATLPPEAMSNADVARATTTAAAEAVRQVRRNLPTVREGNG